ncbi:MAG: sensor histidine kinase [Chitinophagaceae bacterium]|jgi:sensor histidine kinase YesM|nr:MAG: sensor histidine kinase [Chitinophagaceae bacterium]
MKKEFFKQIIFERRYRWLRHLLLLAFYFVLIVWLDGNGRSSFRPAIDLYIFFMPIVLLYANVIVYWFIPSFLLKRKYLSFLLLYCFWTSISLLLIFLDATYLYSPLHGISMPHYSMVEMYRHIFSLNNFLDMHIFTMLLVFLKLFKYWYLENQQKQQAEKEKLNAELQLLKAQLHPHFLFNTLNNLYSLVYEKSDKAPRMLLRLSGLLSYVLYECNADEVLLSKEISIIKDYVALEKERYGDRLDISLNFSGDIEDKMLAPMLFQPFIGNAFKHGTSEQLGKVWVSIDLSVKEQQLYFKVINSCDSANIIRDAKSIGINNVKKRLELLYPNRFELQNGMEGDTYIVSLTLEL